MNDCINNIQRFEFPYIKSNMYIIAENGTALIIDPHYSEAAFCFLKKNNATELLMLLTHEHFDHTCGINMLRESFESRLVCQKNAISTKSQKYSNRPTVVAIMLRDQGLDKEADELEKQFMPYTYTVDETFDTDKELAWNGHKILMESIPGHSPASCLITLDDSIYFTGDSLIPDTEATTRWPGSNTEIYYRDTLPKLKSIPTSAYICPGHGDIIKMDRLSYIENRFVII